MDIVIFFIKSVANIITVRKKRNRRMSHLVGTDGIHTPRVIMPILI